MRLLIQSGTEAGQAFELDRDVTIIGRGTDTDIVLTDTAVSRHHCQILREANAFIVQDMESKNGTIVNGEPITGAHHMQEGDLITVGDTTFLVESSPLPGTPAPAASDVAQPPTAGAGQSRGMLIGGGVIILILAGLLISSLMNSQPVVPPTATATLVKPTGTVGAPTATSTIVPATATAAPSATVVPTIVPTTIPTAVSATVVPTLGTSPAVTDTPIPAATSTVAPTIGATATPTTP
jgi:predicted component of type VI protein secretion system